MREPQLLRETEALAALDLNALARAADELGPDRWRSLSDAAQVVACYLACHPKVSQVRYPGLKSDPAFGQAANTLRSGFGPRVAFRVAGEKCWRLWEADGRGAREQVMELEDALR